MNIVQTVENDRIQQAANQIFEIVQKVTGGDVNHSAKVVGKLMILQCEKLSPESRVRLLDNVRRDVLGDGGATIVVGRG